MKKRLDYMELTKKFNEFRMKNKGVQFLRVQLVEEMKKLGINANLTKKLVRAGIIQAKKLGPKNTKVYTLQDTPLYKETFKSLCSVKKKERKKAFDVENAIKGLKELGYKVLKPRGFNMEAFKEEHPNLYTAYMEYDEN